MAQGLYRKIKAINFGGIKPLPDQLKPFKSNRITPGAYRGLVLIPDFRFIQKIK